MNTTTTSSDLISLKAAAHRLNISLRGIYRLIASAQLPRPVKVGGSTKLFERDIHQYLASLEAQRAAPALKSVVG